MATYNRAWLRSNVASYLHDQNLGSTVDTFIDIGALRIGQMLESTANEKLSQFTITDATNPLPDDIVRMRAVFYQLDNGQSVALKSMPTHAISAYVLSSTSTPLFYTIVGDNIVVRPYTAGTYELDYWSTVTIGDNDADTNPALTAYPFIFLNAALEAGYQFKEDESMMMRSQALWTDEVTQINRASRKLAAGDVPAARSV